MRLAPFSSRLAEPSPDVQSRVDGKVGQVSEDLAIQAFRVEGLPVHADLWGVQGRLSVGFAKLTSASFGLGYTVSTRRGLSIRNRNSENNRMTVIAAVRLVLRTLLKGYHSLEAVWLGAHLHHIQL